MSFIILFYKVENIKCDRGDRLELPATLLARFNFYMLIVAPYIKRVTTTQILQLTLSVLRQLLGSRVH